MGDLSNHLMVVLISEYGSYNTVADILSDSQTSAHTLGNEASD